MPNYSYILDHMTASLLVLNDALTVVYLNPAAQIQLTISQQKAIGEHIDSILNEASTKSEELLRVLKEGQSFTLREAIFETPQGARFAADYTVSPIIESRELLIEIHPLDRLLRITNDEHRQTEQETTQKLIRGLAHEIKNPLGGIRGAAQLLARELDSPRDIECTDIIILEVDRLRSLVDRMLGSNQLPILKPENIHTILERVIQLSKIENPDSIEIHRDYDPSLPEIELDSEQLIQAMLNVIQNACQALEEQTSPKEPGRIMLTTRIIRQFNIGAKNHRMVARINIIDNGPGIPQDMLAGLYFPLISGRPKGTGLGLSITQNIIRHHHGLIECESRPGRTCFSIYLPFSQPDAKPLPGATDDVASKSLVQDINI
ncbi:MAG: PAS domain-containing protein [Pseudomonadales bacterium]|nr:PAS domain-containing protein [Pseudomonadales bacterium]